MKIINIKILAIIIIALTISVQTPVASNSANAYQANHPALFVVRFNTKSVSYRDKLFYAVTEAVKAKPTVVFDVVGYAPIGRDGSTNAKYMENAQFYGQKIADDLVAMGVNPAQVTFSTKPDGNIATEEVKIFVR